MIRDFSKTTTQELKRSLKFHENDNGTTTMADECRRMSLVEQISSELKQRGIDLWGRS